MSMEKREQSRELSEEVRHKIVAKHGQSQGYKSISRDLDIPVSTVHNVIRKFKARGTAANLPGRGHKRKLDWRLQRRIVRMVEKAPQSTAKQIKVDLQTQGTTVSSHTMRHQLNEGGSMVGDPGGPHCWERERHKKAWLEFAKTHLDKPKSFWENVLWEDETKLELFGKAHHLDVYRKQNEAFKEKSRQGILKAAFWALFFFWFSSMISPTLWKILFISLLITPHSAYHLASLRPASSSFFTLCRSG